MAVSVVDVQVNSQNAVRNLQQVNTASKAAATGVNGLKAAIAPLLTAFAAIQAAKFVFTKTAELETQTRSIQTLTGSVKEAKRIISELQAVGAVTPFTSTELIDTAKRLSAFGVAANQVVDTTRRLGDVAGATGANLGELSLAYGQVIAKGRLQGEELLQFQERGVALQDELRKMYGLTGEEFSKALSKGQISAQAVEVALQRLTDAGGKYANGAIAQSDTLNGRLSTLQDSFQRLATNIGVFFEPAFKFLINGVNAVIERLNNAARIGAEARAYQQAGERTRSRFGLRSANPFDTEVQQYRERLAKSLVKSELGAGGGGMRAPTAATAIPRLGAGTAAGGGGGRSGGGADKAASDAKRLAEAAAQERDRVNEVIRNRLAEGQIIRVKSELQDKIAAADANGDKMLAARLRGAQKEIDLQYQYAQQLAQEKDIRAQEAIIFEGRTAMVANQRDTERELVGLQRQSDQDRLNSLQKYIEKQYELNTSIQRQQELADSISGTLGQGLTSAFDLLISGAQDWETSLKQIASGALKEIANQLIRIFIIEQAINSIKQFLSPGFSFGSTPLGAGGGAVKGIGTLGPNYGFPARAMGGSVAGGQSYLVGERGPELFTPGRSGGIAPTGSFGGGVNVTVNVDASGSSVQGNQQEGAALGRVIAAAVQSELIKQKRPGGILA